MLVTQLILLVEKEFINTKQIILIQMVEIILFIILFVRRVDGIVGKLSKLKNILVKMKMKQHQEKDIGKNN